MSAIPISLLAAARKIKLNLLKGSPPTRMQLFLNMQYPLKRSGALRDYLAKLLHKEAFDRSGLIYGMGHAVYSISDPRANLLRKAVKSLSVEKHLEKEYELYSMIERLAPEVIAKERRIYKGVSANVDFYSGFAYKIGRASCRERV